MKRTAKIYRWLLAMLVLGSGIVGTVILFLINRFAVATACYILLPGHSTQVVKLQTILMLVLPVLMLLPEWWLLDSVNRGFGKLLRGRRRPAT